LLITFTSPTPFDSNHPFLLMLTSTSQDIIIEAQTLDGLIRTALAQEGDIHGLVGQLASRVVSCRLVIEVSFTDNFFIVAHTVCLTGV
jgi:hypothetical protein